MVIPPYLHHCVIELHHQLPRTTSRSCCYSITETLSQFLYLFHYPGITFLDHSFFVLYYVKQLFFPQFLNFLWNGRSGFWPKEAYIDRAVLPRHGISYGFILFGLISIEVHVVIFHITFKLTKRTKKVVNHSIRPLKFCICSGIPRGFAAMFTGNRGISEHA